MSMFKCVFVLMLSMFINHQATAFVSALGDHKTGVILVNYADNPVQEYTVVHAQQIFSKINNFYQEMSYGQSSFSGNVLGWVTVSTNSNSCDTQGITAEAKSILAGQGVNLSQYNHFLVMSIANSGCSFSGVPVGGVSEVRDVFMNGLYGSFPDSAVMTAAHEFGHVFGLNHSDSLDCGSEILSLNESTCAIQGYGDQADNMGNRLAHWNAFQKEKVGFLNSANTPSITTVSASGEYVIDSYEVNRMLPKALKIFRENDSQGYPVYFYIEYRQLIGFDMSLDTTNFARGVTIRKGARNPALSSSVQLLDMTPGSGTNNAADVKDGALEVGRSFTDAKTGITISLLSADSSGARVNVTLGAPPSPPPPSADTIVPSVSITSPTNGAIVAANSTITISASASDNVGVSKVEFRVNGSLKCTDTVAPYSCGYSVPKGGGKSYSIEAKAYDAANNSKIHLINVSTPSSGGKPARR